VPRRALEYLVPVVVLIGLAGSVLPWWVWVDDEIWRVRHTVGVIIMVPSFVLWALARHQLGASFTVRPRARALVTRGLYSRIRNPIYVFGELLHVGLLVFFGQPWAFLVLPITIAVQIFRARREARVLEAAFGDTYRAYRVQTWF
jgi:protein-S-isoprenylcysteine O-methyltransferase Ste14